MLANKSRKGLDRAGDWVRESLWRKGHFSRDLKEVREQVLWKSGKNLGRRF